MANQEPDSPAPVTPYLFYEDVAGALDWLHRAFGFREREAETVRGADGHVTHAAVELGRGVVLLGCPGPDYRNPRKLGQATQCVYVYVDDVDAHHRAAREAGATILADPEDTFYGDRRYGAEDPEGHMWYFAQKLRHVDPADWRPSAEDLEGHG